MFNLVLGHQVLTLYILLSDNPIQYNYRVYDPIGHTHFKNTPTDTPSFKNNHYWYTPFEQNI